MTFRNTWIFLTGSVHFSKFNRRYLEENEIQQWLIIITPLLSTQDLKFSKFSPHRRPRRDTRFPLNRRPRRDTRFPLNRRPRRDTRFPLNRRPRWDTRFPKQKDSPGHPVFPASTHWVPTFLLKPRACHCAGPSSPFRHAHPDYLCVHVSKCEFLCVTWRQISQLSVSKLHAYTHPIQP